MYSSGTATSPCQLTPYDTSAKGSHNRPGHDQEAGAAPRNLRGQADETGQADDGRAHEQDRARRPFAVVVSERIAGPVVNGHPREECAAKDHRSSGQTDYRAGGRPECGGAHRRRRGRVDWRSRRSRGRWLPDAAVRAELRTCIDGGSTRVAVLHRARCRGLCPYSRCLCGAGGLRDGNRRGPWCWGRGAGGGYGPCLGWDG